MNIDGISIGDIVLALVGEQYIFAKVNSIVISETSICYRVKDHPLLKSEIISNVTLEGANESIKIINKLKEDAEAYLFAFCRSCIGDWTCLSVFDQDSRCAEFGRILDKVSNYQKLLTKLQNYNKNHKEDEE